MPVSADHPTQAPVYRLDWTSGPCERLAAQGCEIEGVMGLTRSDLALLTQLGVIGKSSQEVTRRVPMQIEEIEEIEEIVESSEASQPQAPLSVPFAQPSVVAQEEVDQPVSGGLLQKQGFFEMPSLPVDPLHPDPETRMPSASDEVEPTSSSSRVSLPLPTGVAAASETLTAQPVANVAHNSPRIAGSIARFLAEPSQLSGARAFSKPTQRK